MPLRHRIVLPQNHTSRRTTSKGAAHGLGLTFQQIQKYKKGTNRIGASRLQEISNILHVPVSFFFDGLSTGKKRPLPTPEEISQGVLSEFLASADGLALARAFTRIANKVVRRRIVDLVDVIADA
jgi:transcriptional regulator with XRE-family HTH domain